MTYKWIRKYFLITMSLITFGILSSCRNSNSQEFLITFEVSPKNEGSISATVDGTPITSGVTKVQSGKEVIFTVKLNNPSVYEVYEWEGGAVQDNNNPLVGKLKVSKATTVVAKIKTQDPKLTLSSLNIHNKKLDLSNLSDVKTDVINQISTLTSKNILATFTYGSQTIPEQLSVIADKDSLNVGDNTVKLTVNAVPGKYKSWTQEVKITRNKAETQQDDVPYEARLNAIEVAVISERKGKEKVGEFKPLENFENNVPGPYTTDEAKTAYIALKMKVAKPSNGDFSISVENETTYISPVKFSRSSDGDGSYFTNESEHVALSKGCNVLKVKVKDPKNTKEGIYTIVVQYAGGPDPLTLKMKDRRILPGIYCPAQRKPLKGEGEDLVWLMAITGT